MELPGSHDALCRAVAETVRRNRLLKGYQGGQVYPSSPSTSSRLKRLDIAIFALDPAQDMDDLRVSFEKGTTAGIPHAGQARPDGCGCDVKRSLEDAILSTLGFIAGGCECFPGQQGHHCALLGTVLDSITAAPSSSRAPSQDRGLRGACGGLLFRPMRFSFDTPFR
jgi:hypothetical protein